MRLPIGLLVGSLLVSGTALSACKRSPDAASDTSGPAPKNKKLTPAVPRGVKLPKAYRLPAEPPAALHVREPAAALGALADYAGPQIDSRELLRQLAARVGGAFEQSIVEHVDLTRPWNGAAVEGQTIVQVPIAADRIEAVAGLLRNKPAVGEFGAVALQRAQGERGPKLAWLDRKTQVLTLADDERGLVTGFELAREYGKRPLRLSVSKAEAQRYGVALPFDRVELVGTGIHDFEVQTRGVPDDPRLQQIADGALTGMLETKQIALGLSTKYKNYETDVRDVISTLNREVSKQNFLVRGTLEELARRLNSVLRSWDGRVLVGVGPARHVAIGLGTADATKAERATLHLLSGVLDNLKLASSLGFGDQVPRLRLARGKEQVGNVTIHVVALEGARRFLPPEAHGLINDKGDLRIALGFSNRAGGAMVIAGPAAERVLADWVRTTADATPGQESRSHLLAATIALKPTTVGQQLVQSGGRKLLALQPDAAPTKIVVHRNEQGLQLRAEGPDPQVAAEVRRMPTRTGVTRTPTRPPRG